MKFELECVCARIVLDVCFSGLGCIDLLDFCFMMERLNGFGCYVKFF